MVLPELVAFRCNKLLDAYDKFPRHFEALLDEVKRDSTGIFWG